MTIDLKSAALPFVRTTKGLQFLLVTSKRSERWIFPKGSPKPGLEAHEIAALEAYEEAGVLGAISTRSCGSYVDRRTRDDGTRVNQEITVFPLLAEYQLIDWQEQDDRRRLWVETNDLKNYLPDAELIEVAKHFARKIKAGGKKRKIWKDYVRPYAGRENVGLLVPPGETFDRKVRVA